MLRHMLDHANVLAARLAQTQQTWARISGPASRLGFHVLYFAWPGVK